MPLADEVLSDLLRRGERARLRTSNRAIQTAFNNTDSAYWQQSYEERQHCHVRFSAAERGGAVQLKWSKQGGEDRPLEKVRLLDMTKLASFLGSATVSESVQAARTVLNPWLTAYPRVAELLDAWASLKSPRGLGTDSASDFTDALQVLEALRQGGGGDQIVRVLSRRLFQNTKRIETLSCHIDLLTAENLSAPARRQEEVFGALGLLKEPQPFLVAGTGVLGLHPSQRCPITWPFIGVSNRHVTSYSGTPSWVLTIENLTTFHLASQHPDTAAGLILFTGGMPSPSWCRAYARILNSLSESIPLYHWGDIDQGGFRIAAHIRNNCIRRHAFLPWLMDAEQLDGTIHSKVSETIRVNMARHARNAGWEILSQHMLALTVEQEGVTLLLPKGNI